MSDRGGGGRGFRGGRGGGNRGTDHYQGGGRGGGRGGGNYQSRGGSDRGGRGRSGGGAGRGGGRGGVYSSPNGLPMPDPKVSKVEDAFEKNRNPGGLPDLSRLQLESQLESQLPIRPGYGTRGRLVTLWTNYFQLTPSPKMVLYRYDIAISPEINQKRKRTQLIKLLLDLAEFKELRNDTVTDFAQLIVSCKPLGDDLVRTHDITFRGENEDTPLPKAQTYRVRIQRSGTFGLDQLMDFLTSSSVGTGFGDKQPIIQALNIILAYHSKTSTSLVTTGQTARTKTFSISQNVDTRDLGAGLAVLRGFFTSIRVAACRILVNVNVAHGVFYQAGSLPHLMDAYTPRNPVRLEKFLSKKVRVQVSHLPIKKDKAGQVIPRIKTVFAFARKDDGQGGDGPSPRVQRFAAGAKEVEFFLRDESSQKSQAQGKKGGSTSGGRWITVFEYFRTVYNKQLRRPELPVINVGDRKKPVYLPAEVCDVLPGQACRQKLSPSQTDQMIKFAVRNPHENVYSIVNDGPRTIGFTPANPELKNFGISISQELITVPGRVLAPPGVEYAGSKSAFLKSGGWNMANNIRFMKGGRLNTWSYLLITVGGQGNWQAWQQPVQAFHQTLQGMGLAVSNPLNGQSLQIADADDPNLAAKLKGASAHLDLILVILPDRMPEVYKKIKLVGDVQAGIHTVCVVGSKFSRCQPQYFANVALKFNLKLGGVNQAVDKRRLGFIQDNTTMIVGIDVTHPAPDSASNAPSIAAMVASIDNQLGQWPAVLRLQEGRKEMVDELDSMIKTRLNLWKEKGQHASYPANILVYRDGVSEGQYEYVCNGEYELLRKGCGEVYPPGDTKKGLPKITIVIVGKRHHTRFYPTKEGETDGGAGNPANGTVVDRGITEVNNWDFFLQAHKALQGTARPAHYFVVRDEIFHKLKSQAGLKAADILEDITHTLCYMYGRATKAVSICPPAYYADIVCERGRAYLTRLFDATPGATPAASVVEGGDRRNASEQEIRVHEKLKNTMFYI